MSELRIMIDPGHGGRDCGASAHGLLEKDLTLVYGDALYAELQRRGIRAAMTRMSDCDLAPDDTWRNPGKTNDLKKRCQLANEWGATVFVSLHCNAGRSAANGAWALHCKGSYEGERISRSIFDELGRIPGILDDTPAREVFSDASPAVGWTNAAETLLREKPVHMSNAEWLYKKELPHSKWYRTIYVLRGTKMPATLIELGFLTNKADARQIRLPETFPQVGRRIADGLEAWWSGD
ncbi:MAG: N-acetylmuramoyl-L-alanine amidase family protein [Longimicrobiales bacterium]